MPKYGAHHRNNLAYAYILNVECGVNIYFSVSPIGRNVVAFLNFHHDLSEDLPT